MQKSNQLASVEQIKWSFAANFSRQAACVNTQFGKHHSVNNGMQWNGLSKYHAGNALSSSLGHGVVVSRWGNLLSFGDLKRETFRSAAK